MTYSINKDSIIFLDLDKENDYHTVACNSDTEDLVAIRPLEYEFLREIYENEPVADSALWEVWNNKIEEKDFKDLLDGLIKNNIILTNE